MISNLRLIFQLKKPLIGIQIFLIHWKVKKNFIALGSICRLEMQLYSLLISIVKVHLSSHPVSKIPCSILAKKTLQKYHELFSHNLFLKIIHI